MSEETASRTRAGTVFCAVAIGIVALAVLHTRVILYTPDGLPAWDSAGYLLEGLKSSVPLSNGDPMGLLQVLLKPDLHPPLHSFLLGTWLAAFGNDIAIARQFPTVMFVAALGLLVWIGRMLHPRHGTLLGLGAAVLTALSIEDIRYLTTPMTENTAFFFTLLALGVAIRNIPRKDGRAQLAVGVAIALASLTRYNLPPMLFVPLYMHHVAGTWRDRKALLDPRVLLWAAPTVGFFALWQLLRPDLAHNIETFLVNRSSGLEFWSVENLLWVPLTLTRTYLGTPFLSVPLAVLFLVGLAPTLRGRDLAGGIGPLRARLPHADGLRLVQLFVVVSFGALTWHDYKIDRSLHAIAPLVYLCALWPLVELSLPGPKRVLDWAPLALLVGVAGPFYQFQFAEAVPALAATSDFRPEPPVVTALQFIERNARERDNVWVTGWVFRLSPPLIEYWLRSHGVAAKIKLDSPLMKEQTRTGIDASWDEKYPDYVRDEMFTPNLLDDTTYITIETVPGAHYYDGWKAYGNNFARAFTEQKTLPEVDRVEFIDEGMTLRAYRSNDTPSAATVEANSTGPTPEDNVGIDLPGGTPFFRETFNKRAAWVAVPPGLADKVKLTRGKTTLKVEIPVAQDKLQLCGPSPKVPTAFTAILHLETEALTGRAWFHYRGVDDQGVLQTTPQGAPDIVQVGPFKADGPQRIARDVQLTPGATTGRLCMILDGVSGTITLKDLALFAPGAAAAPNATGDTTTAPPTAPDAIADATGPTAKTATAATTTTAATATTTGAAASAVPAAAATPAAPQPAPGPPPIYHEAFDQPTAAWRVLPAAATASVKLAPHDGKLAIQITSAAASAQVCGPALDVPARFTAAVTVASEKVTGAPRVLLRGLDASGEAQKGPSGAPDVTTIGVVKSGPQALSETVKLLPGSVRARPCVVLDGVTGTIQLDDVRLQEK